MLKMQEKSLGMPLHHIWFDFAPDQSIPSGVTVNLPTGISVHNGDEFGAK
jgi:hypothetical protein